MGSGAVKHTKNIIPSVLSCMGRNQKNIKDAASSTLDCWVKQVTLDPLVDSIKTALSSSNVAPKDLLFWLSKHTSQPTPQCTELIKPVASCLGDKSVEARKSSETILKNIGKILTPGEISKLSSDSKLSPIFGDLSEPTKELEKPITKKVCKPTENATTKKAEPKLLPTKLPKPSTSLKKPTVLPTAKLSAKHSPVKHSPAKHSPVKHSPVKSVIETPIRRNNQKEARVKKSLKQRPWLFENDKPEQDQIDSVKRELSAHCTDQFIGKLFAKDFNKHIDSLTILFEVLQGPNALAIFDNLDLIFKWITFRLCENNTSLIKKTIEFLAAVLSNLDEKNELLADFDALILLPFLVEKVGAPNETIRTSVRELFRSLSRVYPDSKLFKFILEGIHSKNAKTRAECIEELGMIFERQGSSVCSKQKVLPLIAEKLTDRDLNVRKATMNCLSVLHSQIGSELYAYIPEKERQTTIDKLEKQPLSTPRTSKTTKYLSTPLEKGMASPTIEPPDFDLDQTELESVYSATSQVSPWVEKVKGGDIETLKMLCLSEDDTVFMLDSNTLVDALTNLLKESLKPTSGELQPLFEKSSLNVFPLTYRSGAMEAIQIYFEYPSQNVPSRNHCKMHILQPIERAYPRTYKGCSKSTLTRRR